jgi:acyl transferase domain-containing protein
MCERSVVLMFSGQGSQSFRMGQGLFHGNMKFRDTLLELDSVAAPVLQRSVVDLLYDERPNKSELSDGLMMLSVAIFIVEFALARTLMDNGIRPSYLLTSSMGLCAAGAVAAAIDPHELLHFVAKASVICEVNCPKGCMIAILGSPRLHRTMRKLWKYSDIVAFHLDSHFIVSTTEEYVNDAIAALRSQDVPFREIPAAYPFHSRWFEGVRQGFLDLLGTPRYRRPSIPIVYAPRRFGMQLENRSTFGKLSKQWRPTVHTNTWMLVLWLRWPPC